jgi:diacylglycerol O-acyltransferase
VDELIAVRLPELRQDLDIVVTEAIALAVQDAVMVLAENLTPLHIGGITIYQRPADAPDDYIQRLIHHLMVHRVRSAPWNYRLAEGKGLLGWLSPKWEILRTVDLEAHVAHYSLPPPGSQRQLEKLVSRLHSQALDLDQPLWEFSVIDGLADGRFAIYQKVHHALVDGVRGMRLMTAMHADAAATPTLPPWALPAAPLPKRRASEDASVTAGDSTTPSALEQIQRAFTVLWSATGDKSPALILPYSAPSSVFNGPISRRRQVATHELDLGRVKAVAIAATCKVNDVLVCVCGGALRRYLQQQYKGLPESPLVAAVPMSVPRPEGQLGNALALICANLGTQLDGERERLQAVQASTVAGKAYIQSMPDWLRIAQGTLTMLPAAVGTFVPGIKPFANIVVASVKGPMSEKYFFGARLESTFGASVILQGHALNITCTNQVDRMCFCLVACPTAVPHLERLAGYIGASFAQLEREVRCAGPGLERALRNAHVAAHPKGGARRGVKTAAMPATEPAANRSAPAGSRATSKTERPVRQPSNRRGTRGVVPKST